MSFFKNNKGFTLIEILIAITIIAILFMILVSQVNGFFIKSNERGIMTDFRDFQTSSEFYFRETLANNLTMDSLNNFLDVEHKVSLSGILMQTKSKDPWHTPYEVEFGNHKVSFSSYGKKKDPSIKTYKIVTYYFNGIIDSCTYGFETQNIELTKIKNLSTNFVCGDDISTEITDSSGTLEPPNNFTATNITQTKAELSWSSVESATNYTLKRDNVTVYTGNDTTYSDTTLTEGVTYEYKVAAENATNKSPYSTLSVTTDSSPPIPPTGILDIWAGGGHSFALKNDRTVWAWGKNGYGQLGDNTIVDKKIPIQVDFTDIKNVSTGYRSTLVLYNDGTVWSWGQNQYGELGDGTTTDRITPLQVSTLTDVKSISAGFNYYIALKNDGTVWSWGRNSSGQLGDGTTTDRNTPVQVLNLTNVKSISAGIGHAMALKNDGTLWAWGHNLAGQLGDGTTTNRTIPVQVNNLTNVKSVSAGNSVTVALKNDGTVWTWGHAYQGQLGDGSTTSRSLPAQLSSLTDIKSVSTKDGHIIALKNDGTVWTWGSNIWGQLGDGTTTERSTPVQVSTLTNVKSISAGYNYSVALKNDGTVWAWGVNNNGEVGGSVGNSRVRTPVQVKFE